MARNNDQLTPVAEIATDDEHQVFEIETIDPEALYFVLCDGEIIEPANDGEVLNDHWTATEIANYLQAVNPDKVFSIEQVNFTTDGPACEITPEFIHAYTEYKKTVISSGVGSELERSLFTRLLELAPKSLIDDIHKMAQKLNLVPKPSAYTDDGEPLYSTADMAVLFGIDESQVLEDIERVGVQIYQGNINRVQ